MRDQDPPDWALPSWDSVPVDPAEAGLRPVGPGRASGEGRGPGPAVPAAAGTFGVRILGVSEVTRTIRGAVRADPRLSDLWVEGEIGRVTISSAGHAYFALKDERNQLQCVWFRDDRLRSAFEAQAGLRVVAHGRIDLFEPQGALQLYVESIQPAGFGDREFGGRLPKGRALRRRPDRCRAARRSACGHHPRPWRRLARGPLGVQR